MMETTARDDYRRPTIIRIANTTLTSEAFDRVARHRSVLSEQRGKRVPLSVALDDLVLSHPLCPPTSGPKATFHGGRCDR